MVPTLQFLYIIIALGRMISFQKALGPGLKGLPGCFRPFFCDSEWLSCDVSLKFETPLTHFGRPERPNLEDPTSSIKENENNEQSPHLESFATQHTSLRFVVPSSFYRSITSISSLRFLSNEVYSSHSLCGYLVCGFLIIDQRLFSISRFHHHLLLCHQRQQSPNNLVSRRPDRHYGLCEQQQQQQHTFLLHYVKNCIHYSQHVL